MSTTCLEDGYVAMMAPPLFNEFSLLVTRTVLIIGNCECLCSQSRKSSCAVSKDIGDQCSSVALVVDFSQLYAGPLFNQVHEFAPLFPRRSFARDFSGKCSAPQSTLSDCMSEFHRSSYVPFHRVLLWSSRRYLSEPYYCQLAFIY